MRLSQKLPTIPIFKTRDLFREVAAFLFTIEMSSLPKRDIVGIVVCMRIFAGERPLHRIPKREKVIVTSQFDCSFVFRPHITGSLV